MNYSKMTGEELTEAKAKLFAKVDTLRAEAKLIARIEEQRAAQKKVDALSPAERDYLGQTIAAGNIESTVKVHST